MLPSRPALRRVVAISDLHVDHSENRDWLEAHCDQDHRGDVLLLGGDIGSGLSLIRRAFEQLVSCYGLVFFVVGNHDLWVSQSDGCDSLQRYREICELARSLGVLTQPQRVLTGEGSGDGVNIVPLMSWYVQPEEGGDSLFLAKPGEDPTLSMWADRVRVRWPREHDSIDQYFGEVSQGWREQIDPELPVVSFSHFLPRQELIFTSDEERDRFGVPSADRAPSFNFSRVAGSQRLERQIRTLGSVVHIHGHQHRNRDRWIDGVRYVSNCLGYALERNAIGVRVEDVVPVEVFRFGQRS